MMYCELFCNFAPANKRSHALVVKLVDTPDLGSGASRRVGSSPIRRTKKKRAVVRFFLF